MSSSKRATSQPDLFAVSSHETGEDSPFDGPTIYQASSHPFEASSYPTPEVFNGHAQGRVEPPASYSNAYPESMYNQEPSGYPEAPAQHNYSSIAESRPRIYKRTDEYSQVLTFSSEEHPQVAHPSALAQDYPSSMQHSYPNSKAPTYAYPSHSYPAEQSFSTSNYTGHTGYEAELLLPQEEDELTQFRKAPILSDHTSGYTSAASAVAPHAVQTPPYTPAPVHTSWNSSPQNPYEQYSTSDYPASTQAPLQAYEATHYAPQAPLQSTSENTHWEQSPNSWKHSHNNWEKASNSWEQSPNSWEQSPNSWEQSPNSWEQSPNSWEQSPNSWEQSSNNWEDSSGWHSSQSAWKESQANEHTLHPQNAYSSEQELHSHMDLDVVVGSVEPETIESQDTKALSKLRAVLSSLDEDVVFDSQIDAGQPFQKGVHDSMESMESSPFIPKKKP